LPRLIAPLLDRDGAAYRRWSWSASCAAAIRGYRTCVNTAK
jgi:hypothetical protein